MEEIYKRKFNINPEAYQALNFKANKVQQEGPKKENEAINM